MGRVASRAWPSGSPPRIAELDRLGDATIAFLASGIEGLKVRLTAKARRRGDRPSDARRRGGRAAGDARRRSCSASTTRRWSSPSPPLLDGARPDPRPGRVGHRRAASRAGSPTSPGVSGVFRGSIVSYASEVKFDLLGVPEGPVVTAEAAEAMAAGARRVLGADVGLAVTGRRRAGRAGRASRSGTVFVGLRPRRRRRVDPAAPAGRPRAASASSPPSPPLDLLRRRLLERPA